MRRRRLGVAAGRRGGALRRSGRGAGLLGVGLALAGAAGAGVPSPEGGAEGPPVDREGEPIPLRIARPAAPEDGDPLGATLEVLIPALMRSHDVPGLNALVLRGGEVTWRGSFGWADRESGRPMTPDAVFRVESISKPVTAWGIMKLAEEGFLPLDEPVAPPMGRGSPTGELPPFTPRQLLSHTAGLGLGDYTARYPPEGPRPTLRESLEAELATIGPPGGEFSYSDTGYNLLELILQERTGEDFARWMGAQVLAPLGMADARFDWDPGLRDRMPTAYTLRGRPVEPYVYPGRGSGGLLATLEDVGRFLRAGAGAGGGRVLADSSLALLHTPVVRPGGLYGVVADGYGLGHFTETLSDGRAAVWHGGQGYGWMTHFHLVPETGDGIVLLANSQRAWPLFAHVLRAWSSSLGVDPVRMSRITWAAPLARIVVGLLLAAAGLLTIGAARSLRTRSLARSRPGWTPVRVLGLLAGLGSLGIVAWGATREYLFLFSILPATTGWLGASAAVLGLALIAWSILTVGPRTAPPDPLP